MGKGFNLFPTSGQKAVEAFATRGAVALYDQAFEAASQLGDAVAAETLMALHLAKSDLYYVLSDFVQAGYNRTNVLKPS